MAFPAEDTHIQSLLESRCSLLTILLKNALVSLREELLNCAPREVVFHRSLALSRLLRMCYPLAQLRIHPGEQVRSHAEVAGGDTKPKQTFLSSGRYNLEPDHVMTAIAHVENVMLANQHVLPFSAQRASNATDDDPNCARHRSSSYSDFSSAIFDSILSITTPDSLSNAAQRSKRNNSNVPAKSSGIFALSHLSPCHKTKSATTVLQPTRNDSVLSDEDAVASRMMNPMLPTPAVTTSSTHRDESYRGNFEKNDAATCFAKNLSALARKGPQPASHGSSTRNICSTHNDTDHYSVEPILLQQGDMLVLPQRTRAFQRRTYYRGKAVDERRNPCAPWAGNPMPHTPNSLSVNASVNSLDTLDSLPPQISQTSTHSSNPHSRAHGYSNFRRDDDPGSQIWGFSLHAPQPHLSTSRSLMNMELLSISNSLRRSHTAYESTSFVRLRDQVFEIGVDGRIRRQHSQPAEDETVGAKRL